MPLSPPQNISMCDGEGRPGMQQDMGVHLQVGPLKPLI